MLLYHDTAKTCFRAEKDGVYVGQLDYELDSQGRIRAISTRVEPEFTGQGIAGQLLDALVDYAAQCGIKIVPVCTYVKSAFSKRPEKYGSVQA